MEQNYSFEVSVMDLRAANSIAAKQAIRDMMPRTADRHEEIADHIQIASTAMQNIVPEGYRMRMRVVFDLVPNVRF